MEIIIYSTLFSHAGNSLETLADPSLSPQYLEGRLVTFSSQCSMSLKYNHRLLSFFDHGPWQRQK